MLRAIRNVASKEWRHLQSGLANYVFIQPVLLVFLWGYCASYDVQGARVSVLDLAASKESRRITRSLEGCGRFVVRERCHSLEQLEGSLRTGRTDMGLLMRWDARGQLRVHVVANGCDPNLSSLIRRDALAVVERLLSAEPSQPLPSSHWFNQSLDDSLASLIHVLPFTLMWLTQRMPRALLDERDKRTWSLLRLSPMGPISVWLGLLLFHVFLGLWVVFVQLGLIQSITGLSASSDWPSMIVGLLLLAVIHLNIGMVLCRVAGAEAKGGILALVFIFLYLVFSGLLIPQQALPAWAASVSPWIPAADAAELCRAVTMKSQRLGLFNPYNLRLLGWTLLTSVLAIWQLSAFLKEA